MMTFRQPVPVLTFLAVLMLVCDIWPAASLATGGSGSPQDLLLLDRLLSAKRVTVQRIWGPPPDSCRSDLAPPSDTIACYPVTSVARAPKGDWVRQVLELSAGWTWARGRAGLDPMFAPAFGVHFRGDSLNVDWILSIEPLSVMFRIDGEPSTSAVVPEDDHLQLFELMRRPFPRDRELVERHIIEEERHLSEAEPEEEPVTDSLKGMKWKGCNCFVPGTVQGTPSSWRERTTSPCFDKVASPVTAPSPPYPEFAKEALIQGSVLLHVLVGSDGRVKNVNVLRGVTGLNDAAVDAVRKWVFKPASKDGEPICVWTEIPVDFHF